MVISGRVADNVKKASIQGVKVAVLDPDGSSFVDTVTNEVGSFSIRDERISVGDTVKFTHPNYYDQSVVVTGATNFGFVYMTPKPVEAERIDPVEPQPKPNNKLIWWILIPLGLIYVFSNKSRPKPRR